ncbi:gas vesicle protein GvpG [Micromonospora palomenae]|uniref:Gas vesicle protein GvpG n=1 Tax=Micromonospora palomenae TaxID=1461247 RepID=A0A561WGR3_9ACTN|nr:gas vesicle protein GvpG [Micromonospora palomenae]TWG23060.1 gas vesicle protein GvpG [Micromonospora palomenae]
MDILWTLLTLPYAPVRGLTSVVKVIAREAESRQYDPANIRRELEELDRAAEAGDITPEERDRGQQRVLDRLTGAGGGGADTAAAPARPPRRPAARRQAAGQARRVDRRDDPERRRGR